MTISTHWVLFLRYVFSAKMDAKVAKAIATAAAVPASICETLIGQRDT